MSARPAGRMPVLFAGHGSPMNATQENPWSQAFRTLAPLFPRPDAILSISAHWYLAGTLLTVGDHPRTIHDFQGFPAELNRMEYPAPGDPDLARRAAKLLRDHGAELTTDWGFDHGTWSVLHHIFPGADVPVVQLSIDERLPMAEHLALGRALAPLRDQGVLIMGSGNLVHNLGAAFSSLRRGDTETPAWAHRFDASVAHAVKSRDHDFLTHALDSDDGRLSHPSPDHYLPLLYAVGATSPTEPVRFPITGFDMGSLSMRAVLFG
jgi:4,5-DOPA dioxygenase extradiol